MVKTNRNPKSKDFVKHFFSAVARRTRSKTDQYITRVAAELNIGKKRDFRRFNDDGDEEFESKSEFSSDVDVIEIPKESDVFEIGFEEMRFRVKEKRKGKSVFDMVDDIDDDGWLKRKLDSTRFDGTEEEKMGIFDDDEDEGFIEIDKHDMCYGVEKKTKSGQESVSKNVCSKSQYYEIGGSSGSVLKTQNVKKRGRFGMSDFAHSRFDATEEDEKIGLFDDEEDDGFVEVDRPDHLKNRTKSGQESVSKNVKNRGGFAMSDASFNIPSSSSSAYYPSSSTETESSDDDDVEDQDYCVDTSFSEPESDSSLFTDEEDDEVEEENKPQQRKRFRPAPKRVSVKTRVRDEIPSEEEVKPEPIISEDDCVVVEDDILIEKEVKPEPIISDECIIIGKTQSLKLDESCSNSNLNDDADADADDVEIGVSRGLEKAEVKVEVESDESLVQRKTQFDSPIEIISESSVENVNNIGVVETNKDAEKNILDAEMKDVDADGKTESEKIDETIGSCDNNNDINDEGGLNDQIGVVEIEQVNTETQKGDVDKKIESEKLDETVGSCNNNNNNTDIDMGVSGSGEKIEIPSVESVIEKKMPSVESMIEKMPSVDVNRGKEPIKTVELNENAYLNDKSVEFGLRKMNLRKNNESRKIQESRSYKVGKMKFNERKPVKCDQKIEEAPKTSVNVARKKRPESTKVDETGEIFTPQKIVEKRSQTKDSGKKESSKKSSVVDNGESKNSATFKEKKRSVEILIDSQPSRLTALKSSNDDSCSPEYEISVEDEKRSEEIDSGAPEARRDLKSSDDACDVLLKAILMNEQNGTEKKLFNSEYDPVNLAKRDNVLTLDQLKFTYGVPEQIPIVKTPEEMELDSMWAELDFTLIGEEMDFGSPDETVLQGGTERSDESGSEHCRSNGDHLLRLDEEVGLICTRCSFIQVEIKHYLPSKVMQPPKISRLLRNKLEFDEEEVLHDLEELQFETPGDKGSSSGNRREGSTIWDIIPGVKDTMYQHQQEGFEFIWKNLEGTLRLDELKQSESRVGGCIISHAPGTGKTRLTIVFLQTYLEIFPNSRPVIIAPANMLLTWEEEFRKWGVSIPFHNLNNLDQSAGEDDFAQINIIDVSQRGRANKDILRLAKLFLWCKHKSILGISYSLYEKLVGDDKVKRGRTSVKTESKEFRRVLLEFPGLLVLDEGHTPRNERSRIWKALTKVDTQRRIILSGTPFQNNFVELYNILCLVRPEFANQIPRSLKKFCQTRSLVPKRKVVETEVSVPTETPTDHAIEELKVIIAPFVHVHKGSILKESLPGLKDCVVVLNPANEIQKVITDTIDCARGTFEYEHILALTTVHPSLVLQVSHVINSEESSTNKTLLQDIRLNPNEGSKTSFLIKLIRFSDAMNEKVLVFSQFLQPLILIKEQLSSLLNWTEGREILLMQGRLDQERRQYIINVFNDPDSDAKVLLASTKACSEGINLVGASRVVLLDVVWNPSVERQAISRAYRLGQKKVVHTYHLIMLGTAEWDKFCKQSEKDRLSEMVFSSSEKANEKQKIFLGSEDRILEKMLSHENLNGLIAKIIYQPKETKLIETFC